MAQSVESPEIISSDELDENIGQLAQSSSAKSRSVLDIFDICFLISTTELCIGYLRTINLLSSTNVCKICDIEMALVRRSDSSDGEVFRCRSCQTKMSIRKGSLFEVFNYNVFF